MAGISIDISSNPKAFLKGAGDSTDALESLSDALDDVARDGSKSSDKLSDDFGRAATDVDGAAKDIDTSTKRLERSFAELAAGTKRETKKIGDDTEKNIKGGVKGASEGLNELKSEAGGTARETAASFDGSAESIIQAFQEVSANAFIGFGPAGAAAGLAIAAGLGLAVAAGQEASDAINEAKARAGQLTLELYDAGGTLDGIDLGAKIREWSVEIADSKDAIEFWQESAVTNIEAAADAADMLGISAKDMIRAMSGSDQDAAIRVLEAINQGLADNQAAVDAATQKYGPFSAQALDAAATQRVMNAELEEQKTKLKEVSGVTEEAVANQALLSEITAEDTKIAEENAAAKEKQAKAVGQINSAYDSSAGAVEDYLTKESKLFKPQAYINAMKEREKALDSYQKNLAESDLTPEAKSFLVAQGADAASSFMAGYQKATPKQKEALNRIWTEAGKENSGEYAGALETGMPDSIDGPKINLRDPNVLTLVANMQRDLNRNPLRVTVDTFARNGTRID